MSLGSGFGVQGRGGGTVRPEDVSAAVDAAVGPAVDAAVPGAVTAAVSPAVDAAVDAELDARLTTEVVWTDAATGKLTFVRGLESVSFTGGTYAGPPPPPPPTGAWSVDFTDPALAGALPAGWTDMNTGQPITIDATGMRRPGGAFNGQWVKGPPLTNAAGTLTVRVSGTTATPIQFGRDAGDSELWEARTNQLGHFGGTTGTVNVAYDAPGKSLKVVLTPASGGGREIRVYCGAPGGEFAAGYTPFPYVDANFTAAKNLWGIKLDDPNVRVVSASYTP